MDMRALLEKMMKFAGGADQKQGPAGQLRGGAKMPKKGGKHPAHHKLVGDSVEPEGNMLGELADEAKAKNLEWSLAEAWAEFKEEAFKDTAERRPARKGSREEKFGKRGHKEQPRYNYKKQDKVDENRLDPEMLRMMKAAKTKYPMYDEQTAFLKYLQASASASGEADRREDRAIANLEKDVGKLDKRVTKLEKGSKLKEATLGDGEVANAVVAEVIKLIGEGHTEVSPDVITTKVSAALGRPFMLKDLVAANNASPELQHYISSINPSKIKFSTDILTVKNEDPMKEKEQAQDGVAKMAARAANRPRLGEAADQGISKTKETEFHKELDDLVHRTFGRRKEEMKENTEELTVGDDVIITGPVEHKGETGVIDSFGQDKRFVVVNLYNHGKKSFNSSDVSYNDYAGSDEEEAEMYDRDPEFRDWAARQDVDEGWGAEPAAARHREQMTAVAQVLQKYKNDPVKSKIANYLFVNNWNAQAIEKELADPNAQQKFQANMDKYERRVGPVKDWTDSMAADYLQSQPPSVEESQGDPHKILLNKLRDIERKPSVPSADDDARRAEQAKADYAKYVAKMRKKNPDYVPLYKIDEYGADQPQGTAAPGQASTDPAKIKNVQLATQALKSATGSTAPTTNIAKALDAASQGKGVNATDMKVLEPLMKDITTVAQDPKLANQFRTLAQQINQTQKQQAVK